MLSEAIAVLHLKRLSPKEYSMGMIENTYRNSTAGPIKHIAALFFSPFSFLTSSPLSLCFLYDVILQYCYIN